MVDQASLSKNIDKLSYAVAAVVGLAILAVPLLSGGGLEGSAQDLEKSTKAIERKIGAQSANDPPDLPVATAIEVVRGQWSATAGSAEVFWVTERPPIIRKTEAKVIQDEAVHEQGIIEEISLRRDPKKKKPYLRVKGKMNPKNAGINIRKITLLRSMGDGDALPVKDFREKGDFVWKDYEIDLGKSYSYHLTVAAVAADPKNRQLPADRQKQTCEVLGPTPPVPYDYRFAVSVFHANDDPPAVRARVSYWDYKENKLVRGKKGKYEEKQKFGPNGRWQIRTIEQKAVIIKDTEVFSREKITTKDGRRPVEGWESLVGAFPSDEPETSAEDGGDAKPRARRNRGQEVRDRVQKRREEAAKKRQREAESAADPKKKKKKKRRTFGK